MWNLVEYFTKIQMSEATNFNRSQVEKNQLWTKKKEEIMNLPLHKKRKLYRCNKNFITLKSINIWNDVALNYSLDPRIATMNKGSVYKVDPELNNKIGIFEGDISTLEIDVIVNAANKSLLGGGGVDAVIHRAAGSMLLDECRFLGGCQTGQAKITGGYNLPAKFIIHTVGPFGENPLILEDCYKNCLNTAVENKLKTIAFPCISTGVYGYPNEPAAHVVLQTVRTFLEASHQNLEMVIFCLFLEIDKKVYKNLLPYYFPAA